MSQCLKCGLSKNWNGEDPKCPFLGLESEFDENNWNCGLINKIRIIAEDYGVWQEDQWYASIPIDSVEIMGICLWITWYKSRGRTEGMWIMHTSSAPTKPTFQELEAIVKFYER